MRDSEAAPRLLFPGLQRFYDFVVPLTCVLLMIQGVSETIKSVYAWRTGVEFEHKEKIER